MLTFFGNEDIRTISSQLQINNLNENLRLNFSFASQNHQGISSSTPTTYQYVASFQSSNIGEN